MLSLILNLEFLKVHTTIVNLESQINDNLP